MYFKIIVSTSLLNFETTALNRNRNFTIILYYYCFKETKLNDMKSLYKNQENCTKAFRIMIWTIL